MRYVLIGCGRISTNHVKAATANKLEIVGVSDLREEQMERVLALHGLEKDASIRRETDYRRLLDETKPELAAIATESGSHASIALDCIARGINVIIEKPLAMSMADANRIVDAARQRDVRVAACHQNRFNVAVQKMRGALEAGRFGRLSHGSIHVRWNRNRAYYEQAPWRGTWAEDGGALMNQCIHGIDLLRWTFGRPLRLTAATRQVCHPYLEAEDVGMAVVEFESGAIATIEGTTNVYPRNLEECLYVFGEKGTVKIGGTSTNNLDVWRFADSASADEGLEGLQEATSNVYGNGHTALYRDVIEAVREKRDPYVTAEDGRAALEMVLAIYKSQRTAAPVTFPLGDFASTDMRGEFGEGSL